jgi:hypothetical protein
MNIHGLSKKNSKIVGGTTKMWYSKKEVIDELRIDERTLYAKMRIFNIETRTLPGEKGEFISQAQFKKIEYCIKGPM